MTTYQARDAGAALADGTRRTIMTSLAERPQAVGELAAGLPGWPLYLTRYAALLD